jgi:hypothetical protein
VHVGRVVIMEEERQVRWQPRRSYWVKVPHRPWRRCALNGWLYQAEFIPMSRKDMLPLRSVSRWHESHRAARLIRPAPGLWRLRNRIETMRAARVAVYQ